MQLQWSEFRRGTSRGLPIFAGYLPVAIAFGLLARGHDVPLSITSAWSLLVFAGASQFIALELYAAGASFLGIVVTTLLVNARHVLMSAAVAERMNRAQFRSSRLRALVAFGVTDETFAVATSQKAIGIEFMLALELTAYCGWQVGTLIGHVGGSLLPPMVQTSFGVLLYALFISILIPQVVERPRMLLVAVAGAAANAVLSVLGVDNGGVRLLIAIVVGATVGAVVLDAKVEQPGSDT